jgi:eukaryotic-like serine/threonine-protein kinase
MLSTGEIIDGKYRIVRLLGEGGMGAVYEGENTRIHRRVAIKVLHANVAAQGEAVARFEREAQAAGRIGSDHIVEVLDLGALASGDRYLVMEYMDGEGLGERIKQRGRLTPQELQPIAHQLLIGLSAAHGAGIIHRDLKPDNVFLLKSRGGHADFVKLLDFGISKFNQLSGDSGFSMTRTGAVMGTPYYMAPEQAKGARDLDHRVDLYAVGVILYEALTGQVPFNGDTFNELLFKIVLEEPRPLVVVVPTIDPGFAAIVTKAMARDPALRFQTAREFQEALEQWGAGRGPELATAMRLPQQSASGVHAQALTAPLPLGPLGNTGTGPRLGTGTPGTWAQTGSALGDDSVALPKKSNAGLFAMLGVLGLAVIGGGSFFVMRGMQAGDAKQAEEASATAAAAERDKQAALDAEKTKAAESNAKAEAAAREAAAARAEADKMKAEAAAEAEKAKLAAATASAAAKVAVAPRPAVRPAPRPAPAPKETAKPSSTGAGGRKIRTSL